MGDFLAFKTEDILPNVIPEKRIRKALDLIFKL